MSTQQLDTPQFVFVKYEAGDGSLKIARHMRPVLLHPTEHLGDFVHDLVRSYKSNRDMTYLGLADEDEYEAFQKLNTEEAA